MKTYQIPNTDLEVSRLAYGTWHLGGSWDNDPPSAEIVERGVRLIETAVNHNITFIDLADIYTRGKSDAIVGEAIKRNPSLRDKIVLQAKCGIVLGDETTPGHYNFGYDHIVQSVETSLKRLNTEMVELLLLHRPDPLMEPEEVARAFDHLHQAGKVRYFGVSNHTAGQIALLQKHIDQKLVANQVELNLLHHQLINDGITANMGDGTYNGVHGTLDYCRLHEVQIQAWSPVAGGRLFTPAKDAPAHVKAVAQEIVQLAEQYNTTPDAIALAWLLRHPAGIVPIIGTLKEHRIADCVQADAVELTRLEWYRLFVAAKGESVP